VGISIERKFTEQTRPSRSVFLKWPYGHPLGEPGQVKQHRAVLMETLKVLADATEPGDIVDLPFMWKREKY
jgi:D-proline reductase (dithiol) PrdB